MQRLCDAVARESPSHQSDAGWHSEYSTDADVLTKGYRNTNALDKDASLLSLTLRPPVSVDECWLCPPV
eukprot:2591611-Pleurochrysis_carterae.AAC.1